MSNSNLFEHFNAVSAKEWKQKIQVDLKGLDYNENLVWESPDGIKTKPFYNVEDHKWMFSPSAIATPWKIGEIIVCEDPTKANNKAKHALEKGAESLILIISSDTVDPLQLLNELPIEKIPIHFQMQFLSASFIDSLLKIAKVKQAAFYFHLDILGNLARSGNWFTNKNQDHEELKSVLQKSTEEKQNHVFGVDVGLYQNAGATMVQQLAYAIAQANEYLNHYSEVSAVTMSFTIAVGSNYFFEIAKIRALRWLWQTLAAEYNTTSDCHILAIPTKRNKTLYDYNTNMLRTTTESMAAILGGADTVCNLRYDSIYHKDNEFASRIARNQLLILKEESYFDQVKNPADGSYYIEALTKQMAEQALALFKTIEKGGGFLAQLKSHTIQKKIKESALREQNAFDAGEEILIGTNSYSNPEDKMKNDLERHPFLETNVRKTLIAPILERRLAETSEQKRLKDE